VVAPLDVDEDGAADPVGVVGVDGVVGVVDPEVVGVVDPEAEGVEGSDDPDDVLGSVEVVGAGVEDGDGVVGALEAAGVMTGTLRRLSELSEPTFTLLPLPEMWILVIGALMATFWNCMPMSPKPPSFPWVWLWLPSTPKMSAPDPLALGPETLAGTAGATGRTGAAAIPTVAAGCGDWHITGVEVVEARAGCVPARKPMASTNMIAAANTRLRLAGVCQRFSVDIVFLRCLGVPVTRNAHQRQCRIAA
jgi:hypothetical protein